MILKVISFIIILTAINSENVSAIDFAISIPSEVKIEENITIKIESQIEDDYDVKIISQDSQGKTISEIWNDEWKSGFYYLLSMYPDKKEFTIRIKKEGEWNICVRLRKTGKSSFSEKCSNITVSLEKDEINQVESENKLTEKSKEEQKKEEVEQKNEVSTNLTLKNEKQTQETIKNLTESKIYLGGTSEKTPQYKVRKFLPNILVFVLIFFAFYMVLRKL